jgi:predicted Zn finger-like uncharacterized protein
MFVTVCPQCRSQLRVPENLAGQRVKCPQCQNAFTIPKIAVASSPFSGLTNAPTSPPALSPTPPVAAVAPRGWRFVSSPWVVMVFLFGFLPWSEVSCNSREFNFSLTQSGYQALYGGVSTPPALEAMIAEQQAKQARMPLSRDELASKLRIEQSYLANASPFLVVFWGANLALLAIVCSSPLGAWRLGFVLPLCGVMVIVLVIHACLGLPIERRIGEIAAELVHKDHSAEMFVLALKCNKTVWFWLTLASLGLFALTEPLLNWLRSERWGGWLVPAGITAGAAMLAVSGVVIQFSLHSMIVGNLEDRVASLRKTEEEKRQQVETDRRKREEDQLAEARLHEAKAERLRQEAELKEKEARLLEERRKQAREEEERRLRRAHEEEERRARAEQQRQEEEARRKAEQEAEAQAAREAARKAEEKKKAKEYAEKEAARKAELEKKGLPYYPQPTTVYKKHNAEEWYQMLQDNPRDARIHERAMEAFVALKAEGMPFLLDHLSRQTTAKDLDATLRLVQVGYVHANDLQKLLPCLDSLSTYPGTRMLALKYFHTRAKDLRKGLVAEIEKRVSDILLNTSYKAETKQEVRKMLETMRSEAM